MRYNTADYRAWEAEQKRNQRAEIKRQKDLARQVKEMAKLSSQEQARLEVETYEAALEVLLTVHKEQATAMDWPAIAVALPPHPPRRQSYHELRMRQRLAVSASSDGESAVQGARERDESDYRTDLETYSSAQTEWAQLTSLARRVLQGDHVAYIGAIEQRGPFSDLSCIGSSLHFTVHTAQAMECELSTRGRQAIPGEIKTLTAAGKVSTKAMPKARFVEIYQDYVSGCVLRVARELFALLPLETVLVNATVETLDTATGNNVERPFLSVVITRTALAQLHFDRLDPSDTVMSLPHRGDLKASRKTGEFEFIETLTLADIPTPSPIGQTLEQAMAASLRLRAAIAKDMAAIDPIVISTTPNEGEY